MCEVAEIGNAQNRHREKDFENKLEFTTTENNLKEGLL